LLKLVPIFRDENTLMEKRGSDIYLTAKKIWGTAIKTDAVHVEELKIEIEFHKRLLSVFQPGRHYYMVFNVYHMELEFISPEIADVLGFAPEEVNAMFFLDRIHPDDKPWFLGFEGRSTEFLTKLPLAKRGSYKYMHDYRIKAKNNNYIRLLHQIIPIEYDENSYYRSLVLHTDISHIKPEGKPCFSIIGLDGQPSYYNIQDTVTFTHSSDLFTKREKQILKHIVEGRNSKDIAAELYISIHTVNTHRKNILSKAGVKTPLDLLRKVISEGWV